MHITKYCTKNSMFRKLPNFEHSCCLEQICSKTQILQLMLSRDMGQYHVSRYLDKLQRHIVTAVCEAEEACSKMDQTRHSQGMCFLSFVFL